MSTVPPIRRDVLVEAGPQLAFDVFTGDIGRWWPIAELSVYGAGATVTMADEEIVERSPDGHSALWGTITRRAPPFALAFSWHPGQLPDRASHIEVTFTPARGQTLVTLTHSGWETFDDPAAARAEYDQGWPMVLARYAGQVQDPEALAAAQADPPGETWVALLHRPGPAAPPDGSVFDDPRFGEHIAFLNRMRDAGYLIAAGPLTDAAGEGMTILRLPGAGQLAAATRLAAEEDASVAGGFFTVEVRPWQVVVQAAPVRP
jgi:uncharacterized protein YciI/uncharacterized protein YndB with AHSA1/START domain